MAKPVHSSFHRVMGIRPRGCDKGIQMAMDSFVKIIGKRIYHCNCDLCKKKKTFCSFLFFRYSESVDR